MPSPRLLLVLLLGATLGLTGCGARQPAHPGPSSNEVRQFHEAVRDGDTDIVRRLLAAKPYLANARDEQGVSPLKAASGNEEMADLIRKKGGTE